MGAREAAPRENTTTVAVTIRMPPNTTTTRTRSDVVSSAHCGPHSRLGQELPLHSQTIENQAIVLESSASPVNAATPRQPQSPTGPDLFLALGLSVEADPSLIRSSHDPQSVWWGLDRQPPDWLLLTAHHGFSPAHVGIGPTVGEIVARSTKHSVVSDDAVKRIISADPADGVVLPGAQARSCAMFRDGCMWVLCPRCSRR